MNHDDASAEDPPNPKPEMPSQPTPSTSAVMREPWSPRPFYFGALTLSFVLACTVVSGVSAMSAIRSREMMTHAAEENARGWAQSPMPTSSSYLYVDGVGSRWSTGTMTRSDAPCNASMVGAVRWVPEAGDAPKHSELCIEVAASGVDRYRWTSGVRLTRDAPSASTSFMNAVCTQPDGTNVCMPGGGFTLDNTDEKFVVADSPSPIAMDPWTCADNGRAGLIASVVIEPRRQPIALSPVDVDGCALVLRDRMAIEGATASVKNIGPSRMFVDDFSIPAGVTAQFVWAIKGGWSLVALDGVK